MLATPVLDKMDQPAASVSVRWQTHWVTDLGYQGVFVLVMDVFFSPLTISG